MKIKTRYDVYLCMVKHIEELVGIVECSTDTLTQTGLDSLDVLDLSTQLECELGIDYPDIDKEDTVAEATNKVWNIYKEKYDLPQMRS